MKDPMQEDGNASKLGEIQYKACCETQKPVSTVRAAHDGIIWCENCEALLEMQAIRVKDNKGFDECGSDCFAADHSRCDHWFIIGDPTH